MKNHQKFIEHQILASALVFNLLINYLFDSLNLYEIQNETSGFRKMMICETYRAGKEQTCFRVRHYSDIIVVDQALPSSSVEICVSPFVREREKERESVGKCKKEKKKKIGRKIVGCSVAADGQIMDEDEFDDFGDSKCSLCQRRFEEQGNNHTYLFDANVKRICLCKKIRFKTKNILRKERKRKRE